MRANKSTLKISENSQFRLKVMDQLILPYKNWGHDCEKKRDPEKKKVGEQIIRLSKETRRILWGSIGGPLGSHCDRHSRVELSVVVTIGSMWEKNLLSVESLPLLVRGFTKVVKQDIKK